MIRGDKGWMKTKPPVFFFLHWAWCCIAGGLVRCPLCSMFTSSTTYTCKALSINTFQSSGFLKANLTTIIDLLVPDLAVFHSLYGTVQLPISCSAKPLAIYSDQPSNCIILLPHLVLLLLATPPMHQPPRARSNRLSHIK